jgi:hypothetical protein
MLRLKKRSNFHFVSNLIEAALNGFKLLYLGPEIISTFSAFFNWLLDFPHFLQTLLIMVLKVAGVALYRCSGQKKPEYS